MIISMPYRLDATRNIYQHSKYAPVAVVQLELEVSSEYTFKLDKALIGIGLERISAGGPGGILSFSVEGSPIDSYCNLVLELQRYAGHPVRYAQASEAENGYRVLIEYEDHATALYAGELATDLLNALLMSEDGLNVEVIAGLQQELDEYVVFAQARRLDPNTRLLIQAAKQQDIPTLNLDQPWGMPTWPGAAEYTGIVQFGWGANQRRCRGSLPLHFASPEQLQQVADWAQLLPRLRNAGIPLACQDLEFINRNQVKRAQRSARRIGYPVILRPRVTTLFQYKLPDNLAFGPIQNDEQIALAASYLREQTGIDVWVEAQAAGEQYRFLILNNEVLSIIRCTPPTVTGDGIHNIAELIRQRVETASDPVSHRTWNNLAKGDKNLMCRLQLTGLSLDSVPASGEVVVLRGVGTHYNGGGCADVTREMPSHFSAIALQSAEVAGLQHLSGIDLNIIELTGPAENSNCAVTGIDPAPDLVIHSRLSKGLPHYIENEYLALLFPEGRPARIPSVAITGTNGKTTTSRMVAKILQAEGLKVGLSCSDGVYLNNELLVQGDESGVLGANEVLADTRMEAAVLETARGNMANTGIAFDHCDVGACLNVAEDHLGQEGIETLDDMAVHKRQVIERTTGTVVLNAEDLRCLAMREYTVAKEVILFASNKDHPAIRSHLKAGGRAIVTVPGEAGKEIAVINPEGIIPLLGVSQIPATFEGKALFNVENALSAVAISVGLGISDELVVKGLSSFYMTSVNTPGRMNIYEGLPFNVIVDYAHNAHGLKAFCQFVHQLEVKGQRIVVISADGKKSDDEIKRIVSVLVNEFDHFICRGTKSPLFLGGRDKGEVPALIQSALIEYGIDKGNIELMLDPEAAIEKSLSIAKPGDLLVIFYGHPFREKIKKFCDNEAIKTHITI